MSESGEVPAGTADGIRIVYETFGDPADPPVLLVMGLGAQLLAWREGFCAALVERGLFVVRYDNRDIGLSTHLDGAPRPDFGALLAGDPSSASYTLSDMADDAVRLLDHLGLAAAHVVGASLGGMIAQTLTVDHPERVLSLTSIMSTTGDRSVGRATEAATATLLAPPVSSREEALERSVVSARVLGSPGYPADPDEVRRRAGEGWDRDHDPAGVGRQLAAIYASGDRTARLADVAVPTLVLHGADDPLIDVSGGRATAAAVPGAELVVLDGMGHDLPEALWPQVVDAVDALVRRAGSAAAG
ncbi:alpha/beta fold hydrolase [Microlunatus capsulatus]|uniref:Pimeloyl-ACP methyl ester carboxylesterase n=1 Tax=Microlunatus capsulatus TaxID=99117 RepID=A0ABS4ZEN7_9ACTN|nr:alpha/beta hydrolase [Microlunatus capsulatus]MBP2418693.1 pimeloyl-ACP methyl ester carboxylesterase [Microlunatus capsulatus]